jgi:hypothetical protein
MGSVNQPCAVSCGISCVLDGLSAFKATTMEQSMLEGPQVPFSLVYETLLIDSRCFGCVAKVVCLAPVLSIVLTVSSDGSSHIIGQHQTSCVTIQKISTR